MRISNDYSDLTLLGSSIEDDLSISIYRQANDLFAVECHYIGETQELQKGFSKAELVELCSDWIDLSPFKL